MQLLLLLPLLLLKWVRRRKRRGEARSGRGMAPLLPLRFDCQIFVPTISAFCYILLMCIARATQRIAVAVAVDIAAVAVVARCTRQQQQQQQLPSDTQRLQGVQGAQGAAVCGSLFGQEVRFINVSGHIVSEHKRILQQTKQQSQKKVAESGKAERGAGKTRQHTCVTKIDTQLVWQ